MSYLYFYLFFAMLFIPCIAQEEPCGTLIVSYQTGPREERLDRVRFRLTNVQKEEQLYPKKSALISGDNCQNRMVVIENLPIGKYTLEFLIPNADHLFDEIPLRTIELHDQEIVKINQLIRPRPVELRNFSPLNVASIIPLQPQTQTYAPPFLADLETQEQTSNKFLGTLIIKSNRPEARWLLYKGDLLIHKGSGLTSQLSLPPGNRYYLRVENLDGYTFSQSFQNPFSVEPNATTELRITYHIAYGTITIKTPFPADKTLEVHLRHLKTAFETTTTLVSIGGSINWTSPLLRSGEYLVSFESSPPYYSNTPQTVTVKGNDNSIVYPEFITPQSLKVITNTPSATYTLHSDTSNEVFTGQGTSYTFEGLSAGNYTLTFSSSNSSFIPPDPIHVKVLKNGNNTVRTSYKETKRVQITTNINKGIIKFTPIGGDGKTIETALQNSSQEVLVPEGRYQVQITPESSILSSIVKSPPISIVDIKSEGNNSLTWMFTFKFPETKNASFPPSQSVVKAKEIAFSPIPAGRSILGDIFQEPTINALPAKTVELSAFSIGIYEITNAEYAFWLNQALSKRQITYVLKDANKGIVFDIEGHILCKTIENNPLSQLRHFIDDNDSIRFASVGGKESFPVIFVSWYGAERFCRDNNCRLPTEAEWEKAAAMVAGGPYQSLYKYRFGFSSNTIDLSWANYKENDSPIIEDTVRTSKVGFYNGVNILGSGIVTHNAKNPYGAYDMSGNVWEWVSDWYESMYPPSMSSINPSGPPLGTTKVAKGGCYDSLADGVRAAERLPLPPDYTDAFTGFRAAKSISIP